VRSLFGKHERAGLLLFQLSIGMLKERAFAHECELVESVDSKKGAESKNRCVMLYKIANPQPYGFVLFIPFL
jgi:hypothetical protein